MHDNGEKTSKIAEMTGMSQRPVQEFINNSISEYLGDSWKHFVYNKASHTKKHNLRLKATVSMFDEGYTLTLSQMIDKFPDELKCCKRTIAAALKELNNVTQTVKLRDGVFFI